EESRSTSLNVKLGFQYRFQKGEMQINHNRFLGYTKNENKQLVIDPIEALVVKRIYLEYLEGASLLNICRGLEADNILTGAGLPKWRPETVKNILKNEKYVGDALLQKTYTIDFLEKKRVVNNEIVPQYYVKNSHEAIIPRELHMQVQEELIRRANIHGNKIGSKRIYSSKYALSSIVFCGECGDIYRRIHWDNRGKKLVVWRCVSRLEEKRSDCTSQTISEETLKTGVTKAINQIISGRDSFIGILTKNIEAVLGTDSDLNTNDIDSKLITLQDEIIHLATSNIEYESLVTEIHRLRAIKQETQEKDSLKQTKRQRMKELTEFLELQNGEILDYDDKLTRQLVERITVFEDRLNVVFKSGVEIGIEI
ncbi:MAG: recombinase family protein, partial [Bacillota bacterium]